MNRQRGFAPLVTLVIYGLLLAGLVAVAWAAWASFTEGYREEGRIEVLAKWAPLTTHCESTKGTPASCAEAWRGAVRDAATAAQNHARCVAAAAEQSKAIDEAHALATRAQEASRRILSELSRQSAATQSRIAELRAAAATPAANETEACREAKRILADLRDARAKFFGAAPPPAGDVTIRPPR